MSKLQFSLDNELITDKFDKPSLGKSNEVHVLKDFKKRTGDFYALTDPSSKSTLLSIIDGHVDGIGCMVRIH